MKTERVEIRVTPEIKEKLQALASAEGQTVSAYLTDLIKRKKIKKTSISQMKQRKYGA